MCLTISVHSVTARHWQHLNKSEIKRNVKIQVSRLMVQIRKTLLKNVMRFADKIIYVFSLNTKQINNIHIQQQVLMYQEDALYINLAVVRKT